MVHPDQYYKSLAVGVTYEVAILLTDVLSEVFCLSFCFCLRHKRQGVFYTSAILEVTWYKPLYNINKKKLNLFMKVFLPTRSFDKYPSSLSASFTYYFLTPMFQAPIITKQLNYCLELAEQYAYFNSPLLCWPIISFHELRLLSHGSLYDL